jgi:broad specificity phosphatase PhoE
MITIFFESHGTTIDNEKELSSGHNDVELSELGIKQSRELGERYKKVSLDAVFASDLQRAYKTGEIAFAHRNLPVIKDRRLREINYGEYTQYPGEEVKKLKPQFVSKPFPGGESYKQTSEYIKSFLEDLLKKYEGKTVMIIGHRATQYGLERWIKGIPLEQVIPAPWKWQPGWKYELTNLAHE